FEILRHPDRGDDGVQRENKVNDHDLEYHQKENASPASLLSILVLRFHLAVDLVGGLCNQKKAAGDQDDVTPGKANSLDGDDVFRQPNQPDQQAEQDDAKGQREGQADLSRAFGLSLRDARDDDRQENDVVYSENDFQGRQSQ